MTNRRACVPEGIEYLLGHRLDVRIRMFRVHKQQINVGGRVELTAPVPTLGDQDAALIKDRIPFHVTGIRRGVNRSHHVVNHVRIAVHHGAARRPRLIQGGQGGTSLREVFPRFLAPGTVEHQRPQPR